jgi:hypothetical protein
MLPAVAGKGEREEKESEQLRLSGPQRTGTAQCDDTVCVPTPVPPSLSLVDHHHVFFGVLDHRTGRPSGPITWDSYAKYFDDWHQFYQDGYLCVPGFLSLSDVEALLGRSKELLNEFDAKSHPLVRLYHRHAWPYIELMYIA